MSDDRESRTPWYPGFTRIATYILYSQALKECFLNVKWSLGGFMLFIALTITIVRHFITNILLEEKVRRDSLPPPAEGFSTFWLACFLAGAASLAARYQADARLPYLLLAVTALDALWAVRLWGGARATPGKCRHALRTKLALDIFSAVFIVTMLAFFPVQAVAGQALAPPMDYMITTALMALSAVDFLLNSKFYLLERGPPAAG